MSPKRDNEELEWVDDALANLDPEDLAELFPDGDLDKLPRRLVVPPKSGFAAAIVITLGFAAAFIWAGLSSGSNLDAASGISPSQVIVAPADGQQPYSNSDTFVVSLEGYLAGSGIEIITYPRTITTAEEATQVAERQDAFAVVRGSDTDFRLAFQVTRPGEDSDRSVTVEQAKADFNSPIDAERAAAEAVAGTLLVLLGDAYFTSDHMDQAHQLYSLVPSLAVPDSIVSTYRQRFGFTLLQTGQPDQAAEQLLLVPDRSTNSSYNLALAFLETQHATEAAQLLKDAGQQADALTALAVSEAELGNVGAARATIGSAAELFPDDPLVAANKVLLVTASSGQAVLELRAIADTVDSPTVSAIGVLADEIERGDSFDPVEHLLKPSPRLP